MMNVEGDNIGKISLSRYDKGRALELSLAILLTSIQAEMMTWADRLPHLHVLNSNKYQYYSMFLNIDLAPRRVNKSQYAIISCLVGCMGECYLSMRGEDWD